MKVKECHREDSAFPSIDIIWSETIFNHPCSMPPLPNPLLNNPIGQHNKPFGEISASSHEIKKSVLTDKQYHIDNNSIHQKKSNNIFVRVERNKNSEIRDLSAAIAMTNRNSS